MSGFAHPKEQLDIIQRGVIEIVEKQELLAKLTRSQETGIPLIVLAGFDPSAPDLHLGHTVLIRKLGHFQELGHNVVFLIGDFTARIGDPSGQAGVRPKLDSETVRANAEKYKDQIGKILDLQKTRIALNSTWLETIEIEELMRMAAHVPLTRLTGRQDISHRSDLRMDELLYPILQAFDSIHLKADVEVGGEDQLPNLLFTRELMDALDLDPQVAIATELLEGTDAYMEEGQIKGQKMSQSLANTITLNDAPEEIQRKVSLLDEALVWRYLELLTDCSIPQIRAFQADRESGKRSLDVIKDYLAAELIQMYHRPAGEPG
ncbi:MAG: tyrosine--tRNA ligase [Deltaproteobacteria bacterium]|nr:tyrosine--tRNA ligase [Deltaproteobacteria bacterium]